MQLFESPSVQSFLATSFIPVAALGLYPVCLATSGGRWDGKVTAVAVVLVLLILLLGATTAFEYVVAFRAYLRRWTRKGQASEPLLPVSEGGDQEKEGEGDAKPRREVPQSLLLEIVACFSVKHNLPRMLSVNSERSGEMASLNGVRGLSMALVVLGHSLLWMTYDSVSNPSALYPPNGMLGTWTGQIIPSAEFAVDSFFFLSGFLVALSLLKRALVCVCVSSVRGREVLIIVFVGSWLGIASSGLCVCVCTNF